jgi:hypothetical protein
MEERQKESCVPWDIYILGTGERENFETWESTEVDINLRSAAR